MNGIENLPKSNYPLSDVNGYATQPWYRLFSRMFAKPARETPITLTGSPFDYEARKDGFLIITGGTVSQISIARGLTSSPTIYDIGVTQGQVVIKNGDVVGITYSSAPTVAFFPD